MKKIKAKIILLLMMGLFLAAVPTQKVKAQASVSFQFFYDELSPYGSWVSYPQYGYAWVPSAGSGFRPYLSNGHWVFTDDGWMWVSNYDWGWAPFHYGSWVMDPEFGWVWVPGYDWAPAWVTWGDYNGYYGWAPISPGFSFSVSTYRPPIDYWCFMHPRYMTEVNYGDHFFVAHNRRIELGNNTTVINNINNITVVNNVTNRDNTTFNAGPRRAEFEKTANLKVEPVSIREDSKPGKIRAEGNEVTVFRPHIAKETVAAEKPHKISTRDGVKNSAPAINNKHDKIAPNENMHAQPVHPAVRNNQPKDQIQKKEVRPTPELRKENQIAPSKQRTEVPARIDRPQPAPKQQQPEKQIMHERNPVGPPPTQMPEKPRQMNPPPSSPAPEQHQQTMPRNERGNRREMQRQQPPRREPPVAQPPRDEQREPRKK